VAIELQYRTMRQPAMGQLAVTPLHATARTGWRATSA